MAKSQNQTLGTSSKLEQIFVEWAKSTSGSSIERNKANSYKKSRQKINLKNLQSVSSNAPESVVKTRSEGKSIFHTFI